MKISEHADPGSERVKLPDTIDKDEVDDLDDPPSQVCYFIVKGNENEVFELDPETHILTTQKELDREEKSHYHLYVKATENCMEQENSLELAMSRKLDIELDNEPLKPFSRRQGGFLRNSEGNYDRYKHSRSLRSTGVELQHQQYNEDVVNDSMNSEELLMTDSTIVRVKVKVLDINDNPPRFRTKIFTGGITTNADFGARFMRVEAVDLDEGINAKINYYQVGDIRQTLSEGLENVRNSPFLVDQETGEIQLNFDPQKGMKGYFDFMVLANDTAGMKDVAHVFIYLLREDQKVRFVFRLQPNELRNKIEVFRE